MDTQEAIFGFSQSDKIKSGIIWITQTLLIFNALPEFEKQGAQKIILTNIAMLAEEIRVAGRMAGEPEVWREAEHCIDRARVMANSGVLHEAQFHMTQALTHVTGVAQRSMMYLKENKFLK